MSSASAVPTVLGISGARPFLSVLERLASLPATQPLMLESFPFDDEVAPLILDELDWMKS
jgi:hypothetical protein